MSIVLYDREDRNKLYPLNSCCAVAQLRMGIFTIKERWEKLTGEKAYLHTEDFLAPLYEPIPQEEHIWIDATILPDEALVAAILALAPNEGIKDANGLVAAKTAFVKQYFPAADLIEKFTKVATIAQVKRLVYPWQIFQWNDSFIREDFALLTNGRASQPLPAGNQYNNPENIFLEEGAQLNFCIINAESGPVYIGKNAKVLEGAIIRGPMVLLEGAVIKMGAKIYGASTFGPGCVAGGEIKNVVMQGYSNKAHDGYLGDAVIGSWCNLGAGTTNSNVKNTAGIVNMWNKYHNSYIPVDVKCGVIMGDYSRVAINSSINTGSVIGVCSNVFGYGLLPKYIPDFVWGSAAASKYELYKAFQDINNWKIMKDQEITHEETMMLQHIFDQS
ncbi:putative sugar nucleotidyl transferase [Limnovirga soli]|uniref:Glucose-1-phosphate thymidylyltransferase n=1 Tax=Limnovirga soli TaxID=2656915 RepID=A0A8J8JVN3_9BACT|nr:putative sugar nucleotidyl transferase [Limnovirga soli]NNV57545.1 glucose-1-phosphate thymidylyltransferase [Limnovirga soli]